MSCLRVCGIYCLLFDTCPGVVTTSITAHQLIAENLLPSLAHLLISICTSFLHISPLTSPSGMGKGETRCSCNFITRNLKLIRFPIPSATNTNCPPFRRLHSAPAAVQLCSRCPCQLHPCTAFLFLFICNCNGDDAVVIIIRQRAPVPNTTPPPSHCTPFPASIYSSVSSVAGECDLNYLHTHFQWPSCKVPSPLRVLASG